MAQDGITNVVQISSTRVGYSDDVGDVKTRFGWGTLSELARRLCILVGGSKTLIVKFFGENNTIMALIEVVEVLCGVLELVSDSAQNGTLGDLPTNTLQDLLSDLQSIIDKYQVVA